MRTPLPPKRPLIPIFALATAVMACSPQNDAELPQTDARVDLANGARQFLKCRACHHLDPAQGHAVGPNLHGVFGRPAGALEDYEYSQALRAGGFLWTEERLDAWLTDPTGYIPGSKMAFVGVRDPNDRADLIAYLRSRTETGSDRPASN